MRWLIPTYGRAAIISTHRIVPEGKYTIIVHNDHERTWYARNNTVDPAKIVVANLPLGIGRMRRWIMDNLVSDGEWFVMADDNIEAVTILSEPHYSKQAIDFEASGVPGKVWRQRYNHRASAAELQKRLTEDAALADKRGMALVGFALGENHFFRGKHYRDSGYLTTKMCMIRKTEISFDPDLLVREELDFCAQHHVRDGGILINNFIYPLALHYQQGGIGPEDSRIPLKLRENPIMMQRYPGLLRYMNKPGRPADVEMSFRLTSRKQIDELRKKMRDTKS